MTDTPADLNVTQASAGARTRRVRRCGICRQEGHDRRCCPSPEAVEERRQRRDLQEQRHQRYLQDLEDLEERARQRVEERARQQEAERARQQVEGRATQQERQQRDSEEGCRSIRLQNHNNYTVAVYYRMDVPRWDQRRGNSIYKSFRSIDSNGTYGIKIYPNTIIYIIPEAERISYIRRYGDSSWLDTNRYNGHVVGEYVMDTFETNTLDIISHEYEAPKPVLDQWKECALKSLYLLQQLERLGASNNDNLEPIMDMVQDITIPRHTYQDKELAGVPSVMTNVT